MVKCSFCGDEIEKYNGTLKVFNSGKQQWFCSSKCEKNTELGRKPLNTKWTSVYSKGKKK